MEYMFIMSKSFPEFMSKARPLTVRHHEEVNLFGLKLDIPELTYEEYFNDNQFLVFEIHLGSEIVGYSGFFLYEHLHHKGSLHAKQDILFIDKDHRGKGLAVKFLNYCDEMLKEIGVEYVIHSVPVKNDWSSLLTKVGYYKLETNYSKRL